MNCEIRLKTGQLRMGKQKIRLLIKKVFNQNPCVLKISENPKVSIIMIRVVEMGWDVTFFLNLGK
jgi:hypothetical protein